MAIARRFAEQLALPRGLAGRLLGGAMDVANRKPTELALDLLNPQPGEEILDVGCGTGAALSGVLQRADCRVTGIDPSITMLRSARRRLRGKASLLPTSVEAMPFPDRKFDAALALNVLYFADAEGSMFANLHRVLKPGGRLVTYVTHRKTMEDWPFTRQGLHRLFDEEELADALVAGGFARGRVTVHERTIARSVRGLLACAER